MRASPLGAAVALACLSACTDVLPPADQQAGVSSNPSITGARSFDSETRAILAEARRNSPILYKDILVIGVLGRERTDTSALVVLDNSSATEIWGFKLRGKQWERSQLLERLRSPTSPNPSTGPFLTPANWGGPVGQIYDANDNVVGVMWSPVPWEGYYAAFWRGPGNARHVKCNAGTQPGSDGPTKLWCQVWQIHRNTLPYGDYACPVECHFYFTNLDNPNDTTKYGATDIEQDFIIETPVHVTISGPAQPIRNTGTYTWTANPTGGDGSSYAYTWDYSEDQVSWSRVGTSKSYSRTLSANDPDFYLKASVASISGNWRSTVSFVDLVQPLQQPLVVSISGPTSIQELTYATWTSAVSGGVAPYTYSWTVDGSVAGSGTSITAGGWAGGTSHTIALMVTDAGGQSRSDALNVYVTSSGGCIQPPCP